MKKLTPKQQKILEYIAQFIAEQGYPPAVRDICKGVGLKSPSTVHAHIKNLQELGYLEKGEHKNRALTISGMSNVQQVPILGQVAAGAPVLAVEQIEGYVPVDLSGHAYGTHFALRIRGDSMINAGIFSGDLIIVRQQKTARDGEIVVALLEEEATCKRLSLVDGEVWLLPENDAYAPIDGRNCTILGVVVALYREYL